MRYEIHQNYGLSKEEIHELNEFKAATKHKKTKYRYYLYIKMLYKWYKNRPNNFWILPHLLDELSLFLLQRVKKNSIAVFIPQYSSIMWMYEMLSIQCPINNNNQTWVKFRDNVFKVYGKTNDGRLPITFYHHKQFAKHLNININNILSCNFDDLLLILTDQLYMICGSRGSEILDENNNKSLKWYQIKKIN